MIKTKNANKGYSALVSALSQEEMGKDEEKDINRGATDHAPSIVILLPEV